MELEEKRLDALDMTTPPKLIRRGMLPKELPPCFSSEGYAAALTSNQPPFPTKRKWCKVSRYSLARPGGVRRTLGIPNPVAQWYLARDIAAHWADIRRLVTKSTWALSRPTLRPGNRRAVGPSVKPDEISRRRAQARATGRYVVRADVAEFYRSVYTHSIPWAVHGQSTVKQALAAHTMQGLWSDKLDKGQQAAQNGQTNGLTIGPDTSFVLAELRMSWVDQDVARQFPKTRGLRFYDDFEINTGSRGEADDVLGALQDTLSVFDLRLNTQKTSVVELPERRGTSNAWMGDFPPTLFKGGQERVLHDFFERVFEQRRLQPDAPVVGYALSRIPEAHWAGEAWPLAQDLMSQAVVTDSGAMHQYVRALVRMVVEHHLQPDPNQLRATLEAIIHQHAPRSHTSETAWALWAAIAFDIRLGDDVCQLVGAMEDDVVALLALEANSRGVLSRPDTSLWETWLSTDELYGEHWLFAYEAPRLDLLAPTSGTEYIRTEPNFGWLLGQNVAFMKTIMTPTASTLDEIQPEEGAYGQE